MSVVSILRFTVRDGAGDELVRRFAELEIFQRAHESGGYLGGRLLRRSGDDSDFLVVADWETRADYEAWLENPVRAETGEKLQPLLVDEVVAGEVYEVAG